MTPDAATWYPNFMIFPGGESSDRRPLGARAFGARIPTAFGIRIIAPTLILGSIQFCPQQATALKVTSTAI